MPWCAPWSSWAGLSPRARLERQRARDDRLKQLAGVAAFGGAIGPPDVRVVLREDVGEVALGLHAERRELGDVHRARPVVAVLDEEPRRLPLAAAAAAAATAPALGAHEHPRALQLVAVERELQVALLQRGFDVVGLWRPGTRVPQHHDAGAVAGRNHALELAVLDGVILDVHREPLDGGIERRSLGHRPRQQHAVVLQAEVVVQVTGQVLLHAEEPRRAAAGRPPGLVAGGFRRLREVALLTVVVERHAPSAPPARRAGN
jgi:hypothetical protein